MSPIVPITRVAQRGSPRRSEPPCARNWRSPSLRASLPTKFIAKIASDWNKPDGQFTVTPPEVDQFVAELPVEKIFGVGGVTARRMHNAGIRTCSDLRALSLTELTRSYGKFGGRLYELCRGIDERAVRPHRVRKSISVERTYASDLPDLAATLAASPELFERTRNANRERRCAPAHRSVFREGSIQRLQYNNGIEHGQ